MWHYGIRGITNKWFDSYLSNKKQLVEVNGIFSDTKIIEFGVPQGSILGPLLFSIYVNDLNRSLSSGNCIMYAGDTNVFLKNKCYEELYKIANRELINIDNWLSENGLILNTDKTHYMIFRTAQTKPPLKNLTLSIRNNFVSQQSKTRFLRIIFQEHLSWKPHIEFILKKLCITLVLRIKNISKYFDKNIL